LRQALLIFFDLDGTLFLTPDALYGVALVDSVRDVFGHELTRATLEHSDNAGETALSGLRRLLRADGLDEGAIDRGLERWVEPFVKRYLELLEDADTSGWEVAPHAPEILERLQHHHRLALLTGNPEAIARARLERLGLGHFFPPGQGAFGSDGERRADLIALARERADDWPADETVLVGDTPRDVEAAHEAGVAAVGVTTGRFDAVALREADVVVERLAALPRVLEDLVR
jgi:phosphoglycolate phosphatase-like HAD superfamily hydrolase